MTSAYWQTAAAQSIEVDISHQSKQFVFGMFLWVPGFGLRTVNLHLDLCMQAVWCPAEGAVLVECQKERTQTSYSTRAVDSGMHFISYCIIACQRANLKLSSLWQILCFSLKDSDSPSSSTPSQYLWWSLSSTNTRVSSVPSLKSSQHAEDWWNWQARHSPNPTFTKPTKREDAFWDPLKDYQNDTQHVTCRVNNYLLQKEIDSNTEVLLPVLKELAEDLLEPDHMPLLTAPAAAPSQNLSMNFSAAEAGLISAITEQSELPKQRLRLGLVMHLTLGIIGYPLYQKVVNTCLTSSFWEVKTIFDSTENWIQAVPAFRLVVQILASEC